MTYQCRLTDHQREIAASLFGMHDTRDAEMYRKYDADTVELSPAEVVACGAIAEKRPELCQGSELEELIQTARRLRSELNMAITALRQIRDFTTSQSHSTSRLMRGIAADALDKLGER